MEAKQRRRYRPLAAATLELHAIIIIIIVAAGLRKRWREGEGEREGREREEALVRRAVFRYLPFSLLCCGVVIHHSLSLPPSLSLLLFLVSWFLLFG